ncbi:alpha/beta hydrolase [Amycolatopsis sp. CA-230715]|uniref:alpha/beta hydrolase n=1 Tax=Amycolatopsis sp. CA-230715 TaxID=2745196 RepID=UPI001C325DBE|nr:alpha/beta hydrolase [Amycolatopsis sp. CA-230715]QWF77777.1 Tripeptidyl aminopeptidase [Amycolatopsis sp. CA-230715]
MDYSRPDGAKMELAVSRLRSGNPAKRRGALLVNPGGPGAPGLDLPVVVANRKVPESLLDTYDLIGFDPRGVGHSTPVTCKLSPEQQAAAFGTYAHGPADVIAQAGRAEEIAKQCAANGGTNLPHLTTRNTARDMDRIRQALGERRISYFGTSYGTYLGSVYLALFPGKGDRFLLDSAASPEMVWREQFRNWGLGMELRFSDFARWAAARHDAYRLGHNENEVRQTYFAIAAALDEKPVGGLNGDGFRQTTRFQLYADEAFPALAQLWRNLADGKAPTGAPSLGDNFVSAYLAVTCGDVPWPKSIEHYQRAVRTDRWRYPMVGAMTANITPCARWPLAPKEKPTEITGDGGADVLILQNLRDPATIYAGGVQLRHALGNRARLVTIDQGGHGVYPGRNACADELATAHLVSGTMPSQDRFCAAQPGSRPA